MARTSSSHLQVQSDGLDGVRAYRLRDLLRRARSRRRLHHAAWAISTRDGEQRWAGSFGDADEHGTPMRPDTPYVIASVTKQFIATLVLQAAERGELALNDPMVLHLPAAVTERLHVLDGVDHTAHITIRHLLTHTSGLPDYWDKPRGGTGLYTQIARGEDQAWDFDDVIRMVRTGHTPHFPPQDLRQARQHASYTDTGFQLLIKILEHVTGRSFGALLSERIVVPLALTQTWLPGRTTPAMQAPDPSGIYSRRTALHLPQTIESCNDLISTTTDLVRFHQALLAGDLFASTNAIDMLTERANVLRNAFPLRYGTGTMLFKVGRIVGPRHRPVTLMGHSGATGTWLFYCPQLDVHLAGTIDQVRGRQLPFRLMAQMLQAWHG